MCVCQTGFVVFPPSRPHPLSNMKRKETELKCIVRHGRRTGELWSDWAFSG